MYWYCLDCRQAMPILSEIGSKRLSHKKHASESKHQLWIYIPLHPEQFLEQIA
jgi:hypothetical protein